MRSTWEECFTNVFNHIVKLNLERGGPWPEIQHYKKAVIEKVIPRLLRPMETKGRSIKPSLVHGDLWCGNAAVDISTDRPLIYDLSSFYAHNECDIMRSLINDLMANGNLRRGWQLASREKHVFSGIFPCISLARTKVSPRRRLCGSKRAIYHVS